MEKDKFYCGNAKWEMRQHNHAACAPRMYIYIYIYIWYVPVISDGSRWLQFRTLHINTCISLWTVRNYFPATSVRNYWHVPYIIYIYICMSVTHSVCLSPCALLCANNFKIHVFVLIKMAEDQRNDTG